MVQFNYIQILSCILFIDMNIQVQMIYLHVTYLHINILSSLKNIHVIYLHPQSIILLFGQQMETPRSLSRPRNSHINRRKIKK